MVEVKKDSVQLACPCSHQRSGTLEVVHVGFQTPLPRHLRPMFPSQVDVTRSVPASDTERLHFMPSTPTNKAPEPTIMSVTPRAGARVAPAMLVAHL